MLYMCCSQYVSKFGKHNSGHRTGKGQFSFWPKKGNTKEYSNYHTIALMSHASKLMLNVLKLGLKSKQTKNFQMFKLDLEKAEEPEIKLSASFGLLKKQENSVKSSTSTSLTMVKSLTLWITTKYWEFLIPDYLTCLLRNLYAGKKQQLGLVMEQQTGSKSGKEYVKAVYCHPVYLTYIQSTSSEMLG